MPATEYLCSFAVPDHDAEYSVAKDVLSCRTHLADTIDWRLQSNATVAVTRVVDLTEPGDPPSAFLTSYASVPQPQEPEPEPQTPEPVASGSKSSSASAKK